MSSSRKRSAIHRHREQVKFAEMQKSQAESYYRVMEAFAKEATAKYEELVPKTKELKRLLYAQAAFHIKALLEEFKTLDLPYGSTAYTEANSFLNALGRSNKESEKPVESVDAVASYINSARALLLKGDIAAIEAVFSSHGAGEERKSANRLPTDTLLGLGTRRPKYL